MNFKLNVKKIICIIVITLILSILFNVFTCSYGQLPPNIAKPSCPSLFENATSNLYSLAGLILIYLVWSLFEKNKEVNKKRK